MERKTTTRRRRGAVAALVLTLAVLASLVAGDAAARPSANGSSVWRYLVRLKIDHQLTWTSPGAGLNRTCDRRPAVVPLEKHGSLRLTGQSAKPGLADSWIRVPLPRRLKPGYVSVEGAGPLTWTIDITGVHVERRSQVPGCSEPDYALPTHGCGRIPNPSVRPFWGFGFNVSYQGERFPRDYLGLFVPYGFRTSGCPGPTPPFGKVRWDKTGAPVAQRTFTKKGKFVIRHTDSRTFSCSRCADGVSVDHGAIVYTLRSQWSISFEPCTGTRGKCGGHTFGSRGGGAPPRR